MITVSPEKTRVLAVPKSIPKSQRNCGKMCVKYLEPPKTPSAYIYNVIITNFLAEPNKKFSIRIEFYNNKPFFY